VTGSQLFGKSSILFFSEQSLLTRPPLSPQLIGFFLDRQIKRPDIEFRPIEGGFREVGWEEGQKRWMKGKMKFERKSGKSWKRKELLFFQAPGAGFPISEELRSLPTFFLS
jgi:hypothetical protein